MLGASFLLCVGIGLSLVPPSEYRVRVTTAAHSRLLGNDDAVWQRAHRISYGPSGHTTGFGALWNEGGLYLRFEVEDQDPWHTYIKRDDPLWEEEVVEIFLDPGRMGTDYAEVEINPANVVCDLRILSGEPGKKTDISWNLEGLESNTSSQGDPDGKVRGWTAVVFLPWTGFRSLPSIAEVSLPPHPGDSWRFNVFRVERPGGKADPKAGVILAAWSPPPGRSFHVPEVFRAIVFLSE